MRAFRLGGIGFLSLLLAGCAETTDPANGFTATMSGANEVPATTSTATGTATFTVSGTSMTYTINVTNLTGPASAAHIHVAATGVSGPVRLNLCGTTATPACSALTTGVLITGTATAANLAGITWDELLQQMRNFGAYANVHTAANTGGEIRGQVLGVP